MGGLFIVANCHSQCAPKLPSPDGGTFQIDAVCLCDVGELTSKVLVTRCDLMIQPAGVKRVCDHAEKWVFSVQFA
jgi:hypothetical protein